VKSYIPIYVTATPMYLYAFLERRHGDGNAISFLYKACRWKVFRWRKLNFPGKRNSQ